MQRWKEGEMNERRRRSEWSEAQREVTAQQVSAVDGQKKRSRQEGKHTDGEHYKYFS